MTGRQRVGLLGQLRHTLRATRAAWRTPLVEVDVEEYAALQSQEKRLPGLEAERNRRHARKLVLERTVALKGFDRDHLVDLDRLPLTVDGDVHVEATTALVEVALWARRVDDCQEVTH